MPIVVTNATQAENTGPLSFTYNGATPGATYNVTSLGGSATSGVDYTIVTPFTAAAASGTFTVNLTDDAVYEGTEAANLQAINANDATDFSQFTGTINDNETVPTLTVSSVSANEGSGFAQTPFVFTVTLSSASAQTVTVNYSTGGGTATGGGSDYTSTNGSLTFAPGETSQQVTVMVRGDNTFEADQTFNLTLSNATNATLAGAGSGTGTIVNDDAAPSFSITGVAVTEGANPTATLTINGTGGSETAVSVDYATVSGTAVAGADFTATSGTATFAAGFTGGQTINVPILNDTTFELGEAFTVVLSNPTNGATIANGGGTATVNIADDDPQVVGSVSINSVAVFEQGTGANPTATLTLTRNDGTLPFSVNYTTENGTATAGSDYTAASGTVNFAAFQTTATVPIPINGDFNPEANETFTVTLSAPTNGAAIGTATGTVTITDDDTAGGGSGAGSSTPTPPPAADSNAPAQSGSSTFVSAGYTQPAGDTQATISTRNNAGTEAINITGNANTQTIIGNYGANVLDGGTAGSDTLIGLLGNDTYVVTNAAMVVVENGGEGTDTVQVVVTDTVASEKVVAINAPGVTYALQTAASVEFLAIQNAGSTTAVNLTGSTAAQQITGNAGANIINGFGGGDTMIGLGGNDQYLVRGAGDQVIEGNGGGTDTVFTTVSYSLGVNEVEVLSTVTNADTTNIDLIGNFATQTIVGNYGNNVLNGGSGGIDTLIGLRGDDVYAVGDGRTVIVENGGEGSDTVVVAVDYTLAAGVSVEVLAAQDRSGTTALTLHGNEVAQTIVGNNGANILDGGLGSDQLAGGGGADSFRFTTALGANNVDSIADFEVGVDRIGLSSAIFNVGGGVTAGTFVNGTAALDGDDRILFDRATGRLFYDADGSGAGASVLFALVSPGLVLTSSSFEIVVPAIG